MNAKRIEGIEKYSDQWIALDKSGTKIIAGDKSLKGLLKKAAKKAKKPILMRVPPLDVNFAP